MADDVKLRALIGPNRWATGTALELRLERPAAAAVSGLPPDRARRLDSALRSADLLQSSVPPLADLSWSQLMAALIDGLRRNVRLSPLKVIAEPGIGRLIIAVEDATLGLVCVEAAIALCQWSAVTATDKAPPIKALIEAFRDQVNDLGFDYQGWLVAQAGDRLGIPHRRHSLLGGHYVLGEGHCHIQLDSSDTNATAHMAKEIAANKDLANAVLAAHGLPVARQEVVRDAVQAWQAAKRIGLPVVIKPRMGAQGRGVTLGISDEKEVRRAFEAARAAQKEVLVESTLPGADHRVMVINGKVIALRRQVPLVVGDGKQTIRALILAADVERKSKNPRVRDLEPDKETEYLLARRGYTLKSILPDREIFELFMTPGSAWERTDVSGRVHPDNHAAFVDTARIIGLDIASIDFRCPDISRSWREVGGGICEVESRSGLWALIRADESLIDEFIASLVVGMPLRIPHLIVVAEASGLAAADERARGLAQSMERDRGWRVALATSNSFALAGYRAIEGAISPNQAFIRAVESPLIDAAIYVCELERSLDNGLGVQRPDVVLLPAEHSVEDKFKEFAKIVHQSGAYMISDRPGLGVDDLLARFDPYARNLPSSSGG